MLRVCLLSVSQALFHDNSSQQHPVLYGRLTLETQLQTNMCTYRYRKDLFQDLATGTLHVDNEM